LDISARTRAEGHGKEHCWQRSEEANVNLRRETLRTGMGALQQTGSPGEVQPGEKIQGKTIKSKKNDLLVADTERQETTTKRRKEITDHDGLRREAENSPQIASAIRETGFERRQRKKREGSRIQAETVTKRVEHATIMIVLDSPWPKFPARTILPPLMCGEDPERRNRNVSPLQRFKERKEATKNFSGSMKAKEVSSEIRATKGPPAARFV